MSLSWLPDELLVNIVNRLDYHTVQSVRLLNRRFNYLVTRYNLSKPMAESIRFSGLYSKESGYIRVAATNSHALEQILSFNISNNSDYLQLNEKLCRILQKFNLSGTKSIVWQIVQTNIFNVFEVLKQAGISLESLECISTQLLLRVPFVSTSFVERLIETEPKHINFRNCYTSLNMEDIIRIFTEFIKGIPINCIWNFGLITMPPNTYQQIERLLQKVYPLHKLIYHIEDEIFPEHTIYNTTSVFSWQESASQK